MLGRAGLTFWQISKTTARIIALQQYSKEELYGKDFIYCGNAYTHELNGIIRRRDWPSPDGSDCML
jgi:hypothetical protein